MARKTPKIHQLFLFLVLLVILFGTVFFTSRFRSPTSLPTYKEVQEVQPGRFRNFNELSSYFRKLAEKKGADYAYEVLKRSKVPPNTDLHLLGHTIGDVLYKQKGVKGIYTCTRDFRNACSHSIVVGLLQEKGESAFPQIVEACSKAPGGRGAYTMCFHGLGHGVLAYYDYDMKKTVSSCERIVVSSQSKGEASECIGGSIMEIISGGAHDPKQWSRQKQKYLRNDKPLDLCLSSFMPDHAKQLCFLYLTPHLFLAVGGDLGNPTEEVYQKAFRLCDPLPVSSGSERYACYGGFGKEFTVLANRRDIQRIDKISIPNLKTVYKWCSYAGGEKEIGYCLSQALLSLFWGGENDYHASLNLCSIIDNPILQQDCYRLLIDSVNFYQGGEAYKKSFCSELPQEYRTQC